jgi:hypothetical protein
VFVRRVLVAVAENRGDDVKNTVVLKRRVQLFAAEALVRAAAWCYEAATREERIAREARRTDAAQIVAAGEVRLEEFITGYALLNHLAGETALGGAPMPDRMSWELDLWYRLRKEAGAAIRTADPEAAQAVVDKAVRLARLAAGGGE